MDILNWLYIKKQNLIKTTPDSTTDLVVLGADATFAKRGDKYESYGMQLKDVATQYDNAGVVGSTGTPVAFGTTHTLNGYTGKIVIAADALQAGYKDFVTLNNNVIIPTSRVMVSIKYYDGQGGIPVTYTTQPSNGVIKIYVANAHHTNPMTDKVVVNFEVLPA